MGVANFTTIQCQGQPLYLGSEGCGVQRLAEVLLAASGLMEGGADSAHSGQKLFFFSMAKTQSRTP
jgi:hypothetical protein